MIHHAHHFGIPTEHMNRHGTLYTFSFEYIIRFIIITMFRFGKGSAPRELKIFQSIILHLWCCSTPRRPRQYPDRITQEQKHGISTSDPRQYPRGVSCFTSLCMKLFSSFPLIYLFKDNCALALIYFGACCAVEQSPHLFYIKNSMR